MTRKIFMMAFFLFFFFPPWNFSDETEIREAYVLSAYVHFVVFRFVGDVGGKFVTVGWKSRVREDTFRLVVWAPGSSSDRQRSAVKEVSGELQRK